MNYDDFKQEMPDDEDYRLGVLGRKRRERAEWEEEHADYLLEDRRERERDNASTNLEIF
jgi:hypothetical protein